MRELQFTVPAEQSGKRIDSWLAEQIEGLTRSAAQNLLSKQAVSCNGQPLKKNYKLVGSEANKKRGVKVSFLGEGDEVDIDLYVTMVYGVSLPVVAKNMIDNVRYRVQETTGIKVANVNIHVESISA